jgi:hypothetical protein
VPVTALWNRPARPGHFGRVTTMTMASSNTTAIMRSDKNVIGSA